MTPETVGLREQPAGARQALRPPRLRASGCRSSASTSRGVDMNDAFTRFKALADTQEARLRRGSASRWSPRPASRSAERYELLDLNVHVSSSTRRAAGAAQMRVDGDDATENGDRRRHGRRRASRRSARIVGRSPTLSATRCSAITGGTDAQGEASCTIARTTSSRVSGQGVHTDIIMASALAYVNALNKLDYRPPPPTAGAASDREDAGSWNGSHASSCAPGRRHRAGGDRASARVLELAAQRARPRSYSFERGRDRRRARSTRRAPRCRRRVVELAKRSDAPCCSARWAGRSGTTRRAPCVPEQALARPRAAARARSPTCGRSSRIRALLAASARCKPRAGRGRRHPVRPRAHRRRLLRPAERAAQHRAAGARGGEHRRIRRGEVARVARLAFRLAQRAAPAGHAGRQGQHPRTSRALARGDGTRSRASFPTCTCERRAGRRDVDAPRCAGRATSTWS